MSIPASAQAAPIQAPMLKMPWVDGKGMLTQTSIQFLQQIYSFVVSMNRLVPCNATMALNVITLTQLNVAPLLTQYNDYDTFSFVAPSNSTGTLTAKVVTNGGSTLATLNVYKTNGSAQAGIGDVTGGLHYLATFVDSLNSGNGGLVLR